MMKPFEHNIMMTATKELSNMFSHASECNLATRPFNFW